MSDSVKRTIFLTRDRRHTPMTVMNEITQEIAHVYGYEPAALAAKYQTEDIFEVEITIRRKPR